MHAVRLLKLADKLDTLDEKHFYMGSFFRAVERLDFLGIFDTLTKECGTTACALGWACTIPEFAKEGLIRNQSNGVTYKGEEDFMAGAEFFNISRQVSEHFFSSNHCDEDGEEMDESDTEDGDISRDKEKPSEVAARIRAYVYKHINDATE